MHGDLDLYTKKHGQWSMYRIYSHEQEDDALKDAHYLDRENTYEAVLLLKEDTKSILFAAGMPKGQRLSYFALRQEVIKTATQNNRTPSAALQQLNSGRNVRSATTPTPQENTRTALKIGVSGFSITLLVALLLGIFGTSSKTISMVFLVMGVVTVLLTAWAYSKPPLKKETSRTKLKNTEEEQETTPQEHINLQKSKLLLSEAFYLGKPHIWDEETQNFKKDGHFALILYMLGLSQGFENTLNTPLTDTHAEVASLFTTAHITPESITNCVHNLEEYLIYPRYHAIYQKGILDAAKHIDEDHSTLSLEQMFSAWYTQQETKEENTTPLIPHSNFAVIMFTDIVNSTKEMQKKGQKWFLNALEVHNNIVSQATQSNHGHAVKHTGDGMLLSFPTVEKGLQAAITIQETLQQFNTENTTQAFNVRISVTAGEPTNIGGDLFGLPVNLAAHLLPCIEAGQIGMSEPCYTLCQEAQTPYTFTKKTACQVKGFEAPQTIYFLEQQTKTHIKKEAP